MKSCLVQSVPLGGLLLCVLFSQFLASPAGATSALYLDDPAQAARSTAVALVRVGAVRQDVHPKWRRPIRLTTVQVEEVLFGSAPERLEIEQFGGTAEGRSTRVVGDATLQPGELCVLFLRQREGAWFLTAMEQSKYSIVETPEGPVLQRKLMSPLFVRRPGGGLRAIEIPPRPGLTLDAFRRSLSRPVGKEDKP